MKITRKEKSNLSYISDVIGSRIEQYISDISDSDKTFLDEVYRLIDERTETLARTGSVSLEMISEDDYVESSLYDRFAAECRTMSETNLPIISRAYDDMQSVMNSIFSLGELMNTRMRTFDDQIKAIETNVKRSVALNSVKEEATVVESFLNRNYIDSDQSSSRVYTVSSTSAGSSNLIGAKSEDFGMDYEEGDGESSGSTSSSNPATSSSPSSAGTAAASGSLSGTGASSGSSVGNNTLGIDLTGGYLTLYPVSSKKIYFQVGDITVNKPKGAISRPANSKKTMDYLSNGYFYTRTFSPSPVFESGNEGNTEYMSDNNLLTSYSMEYNTVAQNDPLIVSILLNLGDQAKRVDKIMISLDPGGADGVVSTNLVLPYISKILVNGIDRTTSILDNSITVKNATVGEKERGFAICPPCVYPTASLNICEDSVSQITIELTCDVPQVIQYPEKVLYNSAGIAFYTFNYFETLILDEYQTDEDHPDPAYMYTEDEVNELFDIKNSAMKSSNQMINMNRYFVSIKDIEIYSNVYQSSGFMLSSNLNTSGKQIASVEIYSNEDIPTGTNIRYFISPDKSTWYEISPVGRSKTQLPTRVIYGGIDSSSSDIDIKSASDKAYLRVEMTGDQNRTPCVKSYVARIKLR